MEIRTDEKEDNMKDRQKEIDGWAYRQKGNIPTYSKTKIETGRQRNRRKKRHTDRLMGRQK